jgi:hypothetical protein
MKAYCLATVLHDWPHILEPNYMPNTALSMQLSALGWVDLWI